MEWQGQANLNYQNALVILMRLMFLLAKPECLISLSMARRGELGVSQTSGVFISQKEAYSVVPTDVLKEVMPTVRFPCKSMAISTKGFQYIFSPHKTLLASQSKSSFATFLSRSHCNVDHGLFYCQHTGRFTISVCCCGDLNATMQ